MSVKTAATFVKKIFATSHFSSQAELFQKIDVEATARKLDLENKGMLSGKKEIPSSDSVANDAVENSILSLIEEEKDTSYSEAAKWFNAYNERIKSLGIEHHTQKLEEGKQKITTDIKALLNTFKNSELFSYKKELLQKKREFDNFKIENHLTREPRYKEAKILGYAIVFFIFAFESALNGYFFAKGHELGYLGGISEAIIISIINIVFLAFLLGWQGLRQITHVNWSRKVIGIFFLLVFLLAVPTFNLAVAHYRQAFVAHTEDPGQIMLKTFLDNPFKLNDFDGYMLTIMGITTCIIACIEFWNLSDPYPGYERLSRELKILDETYTDIQNELVEELLQIRDNGFKEMTNAVDVLNKNQHEYRMLIERMKNIKLQIKPHFSRLEQSARELLTIYRDSNKAERSTPSPKRWEEQYTISYPDLDAFHIPTEIDIANIVNKAQEELPKMMDEINKECDKAISEIESLNFFYEQG